MSQSLDRLIYMVNQIAREFENQRPREAAEATYDHLWHFWDPRMREMIIAELDSGGDRLGATSKEAVRLLADNHGEPKSVTRATEFSGKDGSRMSDAG